MVSAAVDGVVAARIEVDEVDEQLTTFDTDETVPVPGRGRASTTSVPCTYRQLTHVDHLVTLTYTHRHTSTTHEPGI